MNVDKKTIIFDMDGLLVDSEPLWHKGADEIFKKYNIHLSKNDYATTTGLRTIDFVGWWVNYFKRTDLNTQQLVDEIINKVAGLFQTELQLLPGVIEALDLCKNNGYQMGLATSSSMELANIVLDNLNLRKYFNHIESGHHLPRSKPHPEVYLNCAQNLKVEPTNCVAIEDSFNGMIAAKAARMKCIVVPDSQHYNLPQWGAADIKLASLKDFTLQLVD